MSLLLVLATLFVGCGNVDNADSFDIDEHQHGEEDVSECTHAETTLKNFIEATCTEKGYTGDVVCAACGLIMTMGSETDYAHQWNAGEQTKEPTCMSVGTYTYTCVLCAATKGESIPTVAHDDVYHDAFDGTHNHTCTMCTINEYEDHVPVDPEGRYYAATCTDPAYVRYECSLCEKYYRVYSVADEDKETGHDWGVWIESVAATCVREGKKVHTCQTCGETETVMIPAAPAKHSFMETSRSASTCTVAGEAVYTCKYCPETETRVLPLAAHELDSQTGNDGWTNSDCKNCDYTVSSFNASDVVSAQVNSSDLNTNKSFEITTKDATVEFPKEVVEQMTDGNASVKIDAGILEDSDKQAALDAATNLTDAQKERLENVEIFNFGVSTVTENFNAKVTVKIPYTLKDGEDADGIVIWFVATNGEIQSIEATYVDGYVTFEAEHFSYYAVAHEETQEMKCRRGDHLSEPTGTVVEPSCNGYGYTVYECKYCHAMDIRDVREKLSHDYSELIAPVVTCDQGGYWYKICSNCGDVKNYTYVRATGHSISKRATCTEDSVCSTCGEVAEFAHGHNFGEWKTVVEPTDVKAGIRRRGCTACGTNEEVRIAPTGDIEKYDFTDYQQMMEFVLSDILHFENGTVTFESAYGESKYTMDVTIEKQGNSYLMLMEITEGYYRTTDAEKNDDDNRVWVENNYKFLYRDGIVVNVSESDGEGIVSNTGMIDGELPFEIFMDYLEIGFDYYAPAIEGSFDEIADLLEVIDLFAGPEINELFEDLELKMELSDLSDIFNKLRLLYAYNAQKLGLKTGIELDGEVPTAMDLLDVLADYTTVSESDNGQMIYTFDFTQIMNALEIVLDWAEENENGRLSTVIYSIIADDIADVYPDVECWDDFIKELKKNFTPNMKVGKAVDKLISVLETREIISVGDLYKLLESLTFELTGRKIDVEEYIKKESEDATLNDLAYELFGYDSLDKLWSELDKYFTETYFGDVAIDSRRVYDKALGEYVWVDYTVSEYIDDARDALAKFTQETDFVLVFDEFGYIVSLDSDGIYTYEDEEDVSYKLSVKSDENVTVEVPSELEALLGVKITQSFNSNGDLVITVPEGYEYDFSAAGSGYIDIDLIAERDDKVSAELGYDVYVLKKEYWSNSYSTGGYFEVDGKYYTYSREYSEGYYNVVGQVKLSDVQADWQAILPEEGTAANGYLSDNETIDVYETALGYPVFKAEDGEWYIATDFYRNRYWNDDDTYEYRYEVRSRMLVSEAVSNVRISNTREFYSYDDYYLNGEKIETLRMYLSLDGFEKTIEVYVYVDADSNIVLLSALWQEGYSYYKLDEQLDELPECDKQERHEFYNSKYDSVVDADGNTVTGEIYEIYQYMYYPSYYVKVDDGKYVQLNYNRRESTGEFAINMPDGLTLFVNTEGRETVKLPSGKTMYVFEKRGSVVYGYTKISAALYVQTACYYNGGEIEKVIYRNETSGRYMGFDDFVNVNKYVTKDGNVYTIDADAIEKLKQVCGSYFSIYADSSVTVGDIEYEIYDLAYTYIADDNASESGSDIYESPDWWGVFGYGNGNPKFEVKPNNDGSITINTDNSNVNVYYQYDGYYHEFGLTDGMVEKNDEMTEKYGQDIYKTSSIDSNNWYLSKDGKYYNYSVHSMYEYEYVTDIKTFIAKYWRIDSLYYGYEAVVGGVTVPVYSGRVEFGDYYSYSINLYFAVNEGKLCVLAGAEDVGESVIRFEELIPVKEYFDTISQYAEIVSEYDGYGCFYDKNLVRIDISECEISIDCGEAMYGDNYSFSGRYIDNNGQKQFVTKTVYLDDYLEIGNEVSLDNAYKIELNSVHNCVNGKYDIVEVSFRKDRYLVKILGKYYYLGGEDDNNYYGYLNDRRTYDSVIRNLGDWSCFYGVKENGVMKYYGTISYDGDHIVLSEPLSNVAEGYNNREIGTTADGLTVYEYSGYVADGIVTETQPDGTVFLHLEGETDGYLSCKDGYYVYAYKITDSSEQGEYVRPNLEMASIYHGDMEEIYGRYVTVDGMSITIDKNILKVIPDEVKDVFTIKFGTYEYGNCFVLDYEDLTGWFEIAQTQNASGKYYEWSNQTGRYEPV